MLRPLQAVKVQKSAEYQWFIISTYPGVEDRVKKNIEISAKNLDIREKVVQVLVPTDEMVTFKDGKKRTRREKLFPGYILVYMQLEQDTYDCVRNTSGVSGFVTSLEEQVYSTEDQYVPVTLTQEETDSILSHVQSMAKKVQINLKVGDKVRILEGPMDSFIGEVMDINMTKATIIVMVSIMGREVKTEVPANQVVLD